MTNLQEELAATANEGSGEFAGLRVCISGAGFAGALLARQLIRAQENDPDLKIDVVIFEKTAASDIGATETGTGLNLNPNGMAALRHIDPAMEKALRACGLPRARMRSSTMTGKVLYDVPMMGDLSGSNTGLRIRWRDAYTTIRKATHSLIRYGKHVVAYGVDEGDPVLGPVWVRVKDIETGKEEVHGGFDMVVAGDGRFSPLREQVDGGRCPPTRLAGVCNFRVLIRDTSEGLFDDMELVYNASPSMASLSDQLQADADLSYCFSGYPRIGIMRMPASATCDHDSLYIFGNFPVRNEVPEAAKTWEVLRALYTPTDGTHDPRAKFILAALERQWKSLHWARMQDIPFRYRDGETGRVLLLGDAAHAMVPTLGQGATAAIEDVAVASAEMIKTVRRAHEGGSTVDVSALTSSIERKCLPRVNFISETSLRATRHLRGAVDRGSASLIADVADWTSEEGPIPYEEKGEGGDEPASFRQAMRQVWCDFPRASILPMKA